MVVYTYFIFWQEQILIFINDKLCLFPSPYCEPMHVRQSQTGVGRGGWWKYKHCTKVSTHEYIPGQFIRIELFLHCLLSITYKLYDSLWLYGVSKKMPYHFCVSCPYERKNQVSNPGLEDRYWRFMATFSFQWFPTSHKLQVTQPTHIGNVHRWVYYLKSQYPLLCVAAMACAYSCLSNSPELLL